MTNELIPTTDELNVYQVMAKTARDSKRFDNPGGEAGILSIMLMARELGMGPMQALSGGLNVIQGKVEISPRMMNTMIRRAGHKLRIIVNTDQECKIEGIRHDTKEDYIASFSIEDARRAGLVRSGGGWEKYPSDMLFARCISRLARRLFADVISTAYVEGEIDRDDIGQESRRIEPIAQEAEIVANATIVDPEAPKAVPDMTTDEFVAAVRGKGDVDFMGLGVDAFLYELSTKKGGKPIPIQRVMEQALKQPERFLKSYNDWYSSQEPKES